MKRLTILLLVGICAVAGTTWAQSGLGLSIKPGFIINAAHIGYKSDNLFIGGGLEFASASLSANFERTYKDTWGPRDTTITEKYGTKVDASVFLPQVAVKALLGGPGEEDGNERGYARPYIWGSVFYSLASVKSSFTYGDSTKHDTLTEKIAGDILGGNLGGTVAIGGEYYIAKSLSLSGEFGCRFLFGGIKQEFRDEYSSYVNDVTKLDGKLGLGVTYTTWG